MNEHIVQLELRYKCRRKGYNNNNHRVLRVVIDTRTCEKLRCNILNKDRCV